VLLGLSPHRCARVATRRSCNGCWIGCARKALRDEPLLRSLVPPGPPSAKAQQAALRRLAVSVLDADHRYRHLERTLRRELPLGGERVQCLTIEEQRLLLDRLDGSYLVVQGPPGSGKTYRGARLITHLLGQGRRVGIVAQSHKVIHGLLDVVEQAAAEEGLEFKGVKRGGGYESRHVKQGDVEALDDPEVLLLAGTGWFLARPAFDRRLDTLVVDEAGQYSLADTLACGTAARRLVLLGDPPAAGAGHARRPPRWFRRQHP
jgi:uncharacterized protein